MLYLQAWAFRFVGLKLKKEVDSFLSQQTSIVQRRELAILSQPAFQIVSESFGSLSCHVWPLENIYELCKASFEWGLLHLEQHFRG